MHLIFRDQPDIRMIQYTVPARLRKSLVHRNQLQIQEGCQVKSLTPCVITREVALCIGAPGSENGSTGKVCGVVTSMDSLLRQTCYFAIVHEEIRKGDL